MNARRTGETTRQMQAAPKGAVFVWCNKHKGDAVKIARKIGRDDLRIVSPMWLENSWRGHELTGLVIDHAARLTARQLEGAIGALNRVTACNPAPMN